MSGGKVIRRRYQASDGKIYLGPPLDKKQQATLATLEGIRRAWDSKAHWPAGTVGRLVERLLERDPAAQLRFTNSPYDWGYQLASVYDDPKTPNLVWVDLEKGDDAAVQS